VTRSASRYLAGAAAGSLLLVGCAGNPPAPLEERDRTGAAPAAQAEAPQAHAGTQAPPSVAVHALPDAGPVRTEPSAAAAPAAGAVRRDAPDGANPAVVALVNRANREAGAGRHDAAAANLERAVKIEPRNAWLWHRLASVRLHQGRGSEAAALALRSNSLAAGDDDLQARNWRLIARVRREQGQEGAAREAEQRARALSSPAS